jgi:hypothetical protein
MPGAVIAQIGIRARVIRAVGALAGPDVRAIAGIRAILERAAHGGANRQAEQAGNDIAAKTAVILVRPVKALILAVTPMGMVHFPVAALAGMRILAAEVTDILILLLEALPRLR